MYNKRSKRNWNTKVAEALTITRGRINAATGLSPAKALLGYELPKRGDWQIPSYRQERQQERMSHQERREIIRRRQLQFNTKTYPDEPIPPKIYRVGERVMVKLPREVGEPFNPLWSGPHRVDVKISNEVYEIDRNGRQFRVHVDHIRPAPAGNDSQSDGITSEDLDSDDESEKGTCENPKPGTSENMPHTSDKVTARAEKSETLVAPRRNKQTRDHGSRSNSSEDGWSDNEELTFPTKGPQAVPRERTIDVEAPSSSTKKTPQHQVIYDLKVKENVSQPTKRKGGSVPMTIRDE